MTKKLKTNFVPHFPTDSGGFIISKKMHCTNQKVSALTKQNERQITTLVLLLTCCKIVDVTVSEKQIVFSN